MGEAVNQIPAIGYSITANLGGDRQVVFQHFVAHDQPDVEVNAAIDRIMGFIDRQKAVQELPELQKELDELSEAISQFTQDKQDTAEANYNKAQASLDIENEALQRQRKQVGDTAYEEHARSGRGGEFKPRGQTKMALERIDSGLERIAAEKARNTAERDQFLLTIDGNIKRRQDRIEVLGRKRLELLAKVT